MTSPPMPTDTVTFLLTDVEGSTRAWSSELSVAREVAAGRTNVEAGERLFIAPSTVKTHLERIYTKLGIRGRAALATEVARHDQA